MVIRDIDTPRSTFFCFQLFAEVCSAKFSSGHVRSSEDRFVEDCGPVVVAQPFDDLDEMLSLANEMKGEPGKARRLHRAHTVAPRE